MSIVNTFRQITMWLFAILMLSGCQNAKPEKDRSEIVKEHSENLEKWLQARFFDEIAQSPMTNSYFGKKTHYDRLDDSSLLALNEKAAIMESWQSELKSKFDPDRLTPSARLSYELFDDLLESRLDAQAFASHNYIFDHINGPHVTFVNFMKTYHTVGNSQDAMDYIARLQAFPAYMEPLMDRAEAQAQNGVTLPDFIYPYIREDAVKIISGHPFDQDGDSPLWKDINDKIETLDIRDADKEDLREAAQKALIESVAPTYNALIDMTHRHEAMTTSDAGVWKHPVGESYYRERLRYHTTIEQTPDDIHALGLSEVERIQAEMLAITEDADFEKDFAGDFKALVNFLRTDPQFTYENKQENREAYIRRSQGAIDQMNAELNRLFVQLPTAEITVKAVEPYREDSAMKAFYRGPGKNGDRPAVFYVNLKDMSALPTYQLQALAYHEGVPGHHLLVAGTISTDDIPYFRRMNGHTVFIEGWSLYAEQLPLEVGLYEDPYQNMGRLSLELFRAARLAVDTGLHHKQWTRDDAVTYLMNNTTIPEAEINREVDRYTVWPGQATAYMIGLLKIRELRARSEMALGDDFDIRQFHDALLSNGSVPLDVLEQMIDTWIDDQITKN